MSSKEFIRRLNKEMEYHNKWFKEDEKEAENLIEAIKEQIQLREFRRLI